MLIGVAVCIWQLLCCFQNLLKCFDIDPLPCVHSFSDMMYLWSCNEFIDDPEEILRLSIILVAFLFSVEKSIISVDDVHSILLTDDFNFVYFARKSSQLNDNYYK